MKQEDKVTVLICVHSQDHQHDMLLQRALESLVKQTYDDFQVLIVMDECHIDTISIVEAYQSVLDIEVCVKPRKQGLAIAKNFGLDRCKTEWVAYLDADDEWTEDKLEKQRDYLIANPDVDLCFTQAWDKYADGAIKENCFTLGQYETHEQISGRLPQENCLCHGSALIRMSVFEEMKYPTGRSFLGKEDWTLWNILADNEYKFYNIPERLYYYSMGTSVAR